MTTPEINLSNCANEPIHIPGRIQPFGALLTFSVSDGDVRHASENLAAYFGKLPEEVLGKSVEHALPSGALKEIVRWLPGNRGKALQISNVTLESGELDITCHRSGELVVVEAERAASAKGISFSNVYLQINDVLSSIEAAKSLADLCATTADQVKALSGYDRVMVYRFDENWNGKVIAEAKEPDQAPFLGLQYPASDIPAQARALYLSNWFRIIPDVSYTPVAILSDGSAIASAPLDLTHAVLRSVSPIHLQYLKNMDVAASMSVSIIKDEKLWGLIACHGSTASPLPREVRQGLEFIGKFFSLQLAAKEKVENFDYRHQLKGLQPLFVANMRKETAFFDGLHRQEPTFLKIAEGVGGGAILHRGQLSLVGATPSGQEIRELVAWLATQKLPPVYCTASLAAIYPPAKEFKGLASGLLSVSIPDPEPCYLLWFKPEVIQTVAWAGNPDKPVQNADLTPRRSFELWQETVKQKSLPWQPEEMEAAEDLRRSIIEVDLERQVRAAMLSNEELEEFAHAVAHDLKDPLRGISAYAGFIQSDAGERLDSESRTNLDGIRELSQKAKELIQDLYEYSKVAKIEVSSGKVNLNEVVDEVRKGLAPKIKETGATVTVPESLPVIECDRIRIEQVFANLISNALKYSITPPRVVVGADVGASPTRFFVRDNGIGIAREDQQRIFKVFERLHGGDEFGGGTGVGLAIVRRIIDRHGGRLWVESAPGAGSTFWFTLSPETTAERLTEERSPG